MICLNFTVSADRCTAFKCKQIVNSHRFVPADPRRNIRRDAPCGCPLHRTKIIRMRRDRRPRRSVFPQWDDCRWAKKGGCYGIGIADRRGRRSLRRCIVIGAAAAGEHSSPLHSLFWVGRIAITPSLVLRSFTAFRMTRKWDIGDGSPVPRYNVRQKEQYSIGTERTVPMSQRSVPVVPRCLAPIFQESTKL